MIAIRRMAWSSVRRIINGRAKRGNPGFVWRCAANWRIFGAIIMRNTAMRILVASFLVLIAPFTAFAQALPGTKLLEGKANLAKVMVEGIDRYLTKQTDLAAKERGKY